ncbi:GNAT family N-acetyltransferase [Actinoplanes derwentensis]|uniref:N-acetyltransferase domain-containing protein n=1 Tax=Actinoplanes derwentensis TaxID=113562 RepID=A0A1H1YBK6_9ACTN|nr:GNAT family N-acetyltransferase [Actinoplanes derwentensis]GID81077.1 hypothetical protein Ade03nite_00010 [Actinoplanes derwentensis]SDT18782.1 hypothetical protein SAMN04489716_2787 [Actinoplanes derwentensis]
MSFEPLPDRLARSWADAIRRLAAASLKGWHTERGTTGAVVIGAAAPALNVAYALAPDPDLSTLDEMAATVARQGLPWSIVVREAAAGVAASVAARHGLTECHAMPVMACPAADAVLTVDRASAGRVERAGAEAADVYIATMAAGFGAPVEVFDLVMGGEVLDAPGFAGYLAGSAATGLGVQGDGVIGLYNVTVVPSRRGEGLGRAMTVRALADGFAAGAEIAYLMPSVEGRPLYESIGFSDVETWAMFSHD